jgi:hypothetical protein
MYQHVIPDGTYHVAHSKPGYDIAWNPLPYIFARMLLLPRSVQTRLSSTPHLGDSSERVDFDDTIQVRQTVRGDSPLSRPTLLTIFGSNSQCV